VGLAAVIALVLALAATSWAAVQGLAAVTPAWAAALVVGGAWAVAAAALLSLEHPRRLRRRLEEETSAQAVAAAEQTRVEAAARVKNTAESLAAAVAEEAAEREIRAGVTAAEHLAEGAELEAEDLLKEFVVALLAPGRAGISLLERIVGREPPER
jgi:hypothetical protein